MKSDRQLDTEDWKAFRKEAQESKAVKRSGITTQVYKFCVENSINCEVKSEYHFRLTRDGYTPVDVFPTSSKVHVLNGKNANRKQYKRVNIIQFLKNHFN